MSKNYKYNFSDNITCEIEVGIDGVKQEHVDFLMEDDKKEESRSCYARKKESSLDNYYEDKIGTYDKNSIDEEENELSGVEYLLRDCIGRLSEKQQELYYMTMGQSMTYDEVAKKEGVTRQAIYGQMETIKKRLKKMLEELQ